MWKQYKTFRSQRGKSFYGPIYFYVTFTVDFTVRIATQQGICYVTKGVQMAMGGGVQAFIHTKILFIRTVLLQYPRSGLKYYLQTDSIGFGIVGLLYQNMEDGEPSVVCLVSRSLRGAELNYTTTKKNNY